MADSAFWRKLAKKFRALPRESSTLIFGEKHWTETDKNDWTWRVGGNDTLRVHFEALARRAALALPEPRHPDLLFTWLESLVRRGHARFDREFVGTSTIGAVTVKSITATLYKLPRHSTDYCKILESEALQREFDGKHDSGAKPVALREQTSPKAANETLGQQIHRLRRECNWTIERLATKAGLDETTVKRHLSGKQVPHPSTVIRYQRAFSQALRKEIVISQTP